MLWVILYSHGTPGACILEQTHVVHARYDPEETDEPQCFTQNQVRSPCDGFFRQACCQQIRIILQTIDMQVQEAEKLETGLQMSFCPQFSPSGNSLVFMSHNAAVTSGAHCASVTLESLPWPAKGVRSHEPPILTKLNTNC